MVSKFCSRLQAELDPQKESHIQIAVSSFCIDVETANFVQILYAQQDGEGGFTLADSLPLPYPASALQFSRRQAGVLAAVGDRARIWRPAQGRAPDAERDCTVLKLAAADAEWCVPLTCCDWSPTEAALLAVGHSSGCVTLWDLGSPGGATAACARCSERGVRAVAWQGAASQGEHGGSAFAVASADGSLRLWDSRDMRGPSATLYQWGLRGVPMQARRPRRSFAPPCAPCAARLHRRSADCPSARCRLAPGAPPTRRCCSPSRRTLPPRWCWTPDAPAPPALRWLRSSSCRRAPWLPQPGRRRPRMW